MKTKIFLTVLILNAVYFSCFSQVSIAGLGFNYSALVRDSSGRVQPSKQVKLRFTLLPGQNSTSSNAAWVETQNVNTDAYGFVNVSIGAGVKAGGAANVFADIDFTQANFWILIEVLNSANQKYEALAKEPLQAVPYAKVAGTVAGIAVTPPGSIIAFAGDSSHIPAGWMLCDGRELDNADARYAALFAAIQYTWGTSNHANKFNIPYTLGQFLRGTNYGSGNDPDAALRTPSQAGANGGDNVGSLQRDAFQGHGHNMGSTLTGENAPALRVMSWKQGAGYNLKHDGALVEYSNISVSDARDIGNGVPLVSNETRGKNVNVNYIIKL